MIYYKNIQTAPKQYIAPVDLQVLGNAYSTLEQGHLKALEAKTQLETAIAQLDMDESEDEFKAKLASDISTQIDNNAINGNLYYSIGEIIRQQGNVAKNPAVIGRVQANAERKQFLEEVKAMDVDEDIKAMTRELNPYHYEDKYDKDGNIIGGSTWTPSYTPVKQIDITSKLKDWISFASPDKGRVADIQFIDSNGNITREYTPGTNVRVFNEGTAEWETLSPEKLASAINFGLQNSPGAMASLRQDMMVGLWKANKITGDDENTLNAKIEASNGALDEHGQVKSLGQYIMDRISPAIYAKAYDNQFVNPKFHNDALKYLEENSLLKNNYLSETFSDIPTVAGPNTIVSDDSVAKSGLAITQLNENIAASLRNAGIPEEELRGVLWNDIDNIERLLTENNVPNAENILNDIRRQINLNGAQIEYYNQLHSGDYTAKELSGLDFVSALEGGINPNNVSYKDRTYIDKYNNLINHSLGSAEGVGFNSTAETINNIVLAFGGEQKLNNLGIEIIYERDGSSTISIPKEVVHRVIDIAPYIEQYADVRKGNINKSGLIRDGHFVPHSEDYKYGDENDPNFKTGTIGGPYNFGITGLANDINRIKKSAQKASKEIKDSEYLVPTRLSPTSSPLEYYWAQVRQSAPDKTTRDFANAQISDLQDLLKQELNILDFRTSNYTFVDEDGRTVELSSKDRKELQSKWDVNKSSNIDFAAKNAGMYINPWTGQAYTFISIDTDDDKFKGLRMIMDKGRYSEEFNKLNNSASMKADADLYRSSRNNAPIQVGFDDTNNMFIRYNGATDTEGNNYYALYNGGTKIRDNLTAEEARKCILDYRTLLELGERYKRIDMNAPSENPNMTNREFIEASLPELAKNYEYLYGSQAENFIRNILGI